jgi:hypothetical protein
MKFLVTTTPNRLQVPPVALMEAAKAWINARLADKTFDCCYGFATGGGFSIVNADSPERVAQLLMEYPAYMGSDWKVDPLCDINKNLDQVIAMIKRAGG